MGNQISSLYIDKCGFLMCGEPEKSTSIVNGVTEIIRPKKLGGNKISAMLEYDLLFINDLGIECRGYHAQCDSEYKYKHDG